MCVSVSVSVCLSLFPRAELLIQDLWCWIRGGTDEIESESRLGYTK